MGWKIIKDYLHDESPHFHEKSEVGRERDYKGGQLKCRVGDDDLNKYYMALCDDDDSMEAFHDWAQYDSGCTWSEWYDIERKEWRGFIS